MVHKEMMNYRNKNVAHHSFDIDERPKNRPYLDALRSTGFVIYERAYRSLLDDGYLGRMLPDPLRISGDRLAGVEEHWAKIIRTARRAVQNFRDAP